MTITCAVCPNIIRNASEHRRTCSMRCRSLWFSLHTRGKGMPEYALAGWRLKNRRRVEASVQAKFGPLSLREVQIFNEGVRVGHRKGYMAMRRREARAA